MRLSLQQQNRETFVIDFESIEGDDKFKKFAFIYALLDCISDYSKKNGNSTTEKTSKSNSRKSAK